MSGGVSHRRTNVYSPSFLGMFFVEKERVAHHLSILASLREVVTPESILPFSTFFSWWEASPGSENFVWRGGEHQPHCKAAALHSDVLTWHHHFGLIPNSLVAFIALALWHECTALVIYGMWCSLRAGLPHFSSSLHFHFIGNKPKNPLICAQYGPCLRNWDGKLWPFVSMWVDLTMRHFGLPWGRLIRRGRETEQRAWWIQAFSITIYWGEWRI